MNYDVMPWGAVNKDWFEPLPGQSLVDPLRSHPAAAGIPPRTVSDSELDEAELSTRMVLNQLHADTGEQILVSRSSSGIQVKGVVDTDQRKQQIETHLLQVTHVHTSLLSVEELGSHSRFGLQRGELSIQVYSIGSQPPPLEIYMRERKMPLDRLEPTSP